MNASEITDCTGECQPLPYELNAEEKAAVAKHRAEQCPQGGRCNTVHFCLPLFRQYPDGPLHGCIVCGEAIA